MMHAAFWLWGPFALRGGGRQPTVHQHGECRSRYERVFAMVALTAVRRSSY